ncbi:MAG: hypothetical protein A3C02_01600 [Candidatus Andersenbacteria bacterium RIFCSPHIGHO2_02_FULL_45_11]|uniref:Uncharacterized protein n=1 Tax=Candidatus Andersenbacteria bacterium RIFCSPHIGHO2_12_FULL_45_11 TaxID=1797281 RepID=A0A1G1X240_9BACT|nr:MAG: hypothetical protein A2805_02315 [Candidatus Andersenbacteria bacterium RIFCSPHIGHO2_01_FULL_46_36]OGY32755.1 MAG: hypothetical protein A3C02_01600 [Candidatus Andersenbacteria bacterium RIFCSPHIGHO2_02_FULL_45_11]OGY34072.1 MAG: hypothetical protein A3D99_02355 [Candidatus Andersenbacteria bacterium RIFCSPHIGHO2_12_FULL_45_11]
MEIAINGSVLRKTIADLSLNIAAFWFTAAFIVPIFSPDSAAREIAALLLDLFLGTVFLGLSYNLNLPNQEL